jgi:hypothetical protein
LACQHSLCYLQANDFSINDSNKSRNMHDYKTIVTFAVIMELISIKICAVGLLPIFYVALQRFFLELPGSGFVYGLIAVWKNCPRIEVLLPAAALRSLHRYRE